MATPAEAGVEACAINIGRRERRDRLVGGILAFALSGAAAVLLRASGGPAFLDLILFLPLLAGFLGVFQAVAGT